MPPEDLDADEDDEADAGGDAGEMVDEVDEVEEPDQVEDLGGAAKIDAILDQLGSNGNVTMYVHELCDGGEEEFVGKWTADSWDLQRFAEFAGGGKFRARFMLDGRRGLRKQQDFNISDVFGAGTRGREDDDAGDVVAPIETNNPLMQLVIAQINASNRLALEAVRSKSGSSGVREAAEIIRLARSLSGDAPAPFDEEGEGGSFLEKLAIIGARTFAPVLAATMAPTPTPPAAHPSGPRPPTPLPARRVHTTVRPSPQINPQRLAAGVAALRRCLEPSIADTAASLDDRAQRAAAEIMRTYGPGVVTQVLAAMQPGQLAPELVTQAPDLAPHAELIDRTEQALRAALANPPHPPQAPTHDSAQPPMDQAPAAGG